MIFTKQTVLISSTAIPIQPSRMVTTNDQIVKDKKKKEKKEQLLSSIKLSTSEIQHQRRINEHKMHRKTLKEIIVLTGSTATYSGGYGFF
jgi:hypothetical protein